MQYVIPLSPPPTPSPTPDEDVESLSSKDNKNMYTIQIKADQQKVSIDPLKIVNDFFAEETETFFISLSPGPNKTDYSYKIKPSNITVFITDNDGKSHHIC